MNSTTMMRRKSRVRFLITRILLSCALPTGAFAADGTNLSAQPVLSVQPVREADRALTNPLEASWNPIAWLDASPLVQAGYFSSYDRTGGNDDGFKGTYSSLYELPNGEHTILDLQGPGCLLTLWFTGPDQGRILPYGNVRFYLDDAISPLASIDCQRLFSGEIAGFPRPLVADSMTATGGNVSHVPVPFAKRLIVTTEKVVNFYNAFYHLYPPGTPIRSWTGKEDLSPAIRAWSMAGNTAPGLGGYVHGPASAPAATAEGEAAIGSPANAGPELIRKRFALPGSRTKGQPTAVELASIGGTGVIQALRINPAIPPSAFALNNVWLRIWWDGEAKPSVDVPLGPFFGSGIGEGSVRSLPIGMSPSGPYYCHFLMPFARSARIMLENRTFDDVGEFYAEVEVDRSNRKAASRTRRFHAVYHREWPAEKDRDFTILDEPAGAGTYLGHTLIVEPYAADNKQWWEGDLRVWVDHRRHPILQGTGHEDELLGGWSNTWLKNPYSLPLHGLAVVRLFLDRADAQYNGAISAYRFFAGGIPFRDGIRVSTEHGTNNVVVTNYSAVAYYYHAPAPAMVLTDSLKLGEMDLEESHGYSAKGGAACQLQTSFDADDAVPGRPPLLCRGRRGQTSESFTIRINAANHGVLLRRVYHQAAGRHSAHLSVNGRPVLIADVPESFNVDRWREQDLMLPPALTAGKDRLDLRFDRIDGTWNSFIYLVYSLTE